MWNEDLDAVVSGACLVIILGGLGLILLML